MKVYEFGMMNEKREFKGLVHAELVPMFPDRFHSEVTRFLTE